MRRRMLKEKRLMRWWTLTLISRKSSCFKIKSDPNLKFQRVTKNSKRINQKVNQKAHKKMMYLKNLKHHLKNL
jgi:hypothetical protein